MSGLITNYMMSGVIADRPATPSVSTDSLSFYYATDTSTLSVWDGSSWSDVGGGGGGGTTPFAPWTVPEAADFTGYNLDASTFADHSEGAGIVFKDPGAQGTEVRGFAKSIGSGPWTLYTRVTWTLLPLGSTDRIGVMLRNSSNGKLITYGLLNTVDGVKSWRIERWTNATTYGSAPTTVFTNPAVEPVWSKLENDGTNIKWSVGDGYEWTQINSETLASFIGTADQAGFGGQMVNKCQIVLNSFSTTAPAAGGGGPA